MEYELDINIVNTDQDPTLTKLHNGKYNLYIFKAVQSSAAGGAPLVWQGYRYDEYEDDTTLTWTEIYSGFISKIVIAPDVSFLSTKSISMDFGDMLVVDSSGNIIKNSSGQKTDFEFQDTNTDIDYTCGICQKDRNGKMVPMCAFPLITGATDYITPIEKVGLFFATAPINTGSVKEYSKANDGIIIDLTNPNIKRSVEFSLKTGWKTTDSIDNGQHFGPNDKLVDILITSDQDMKLAKAVIAPSISKN